MDNDEKDNEKIRHMYKSILAVFPQINKKPVKFLLVKNQNDWSYRLISTLHPFFDNENELSEFIKEYYVEVINE